MKIAAKITLMTFIFIIAVSTALASFVYYFQAKALTADIRMDISRMAERLFDMVNIFMHERSADMEIFATSPVFNPENYSQPAVTKRLLEYRDAYHCYDSIALFDLNRMRIADTTGLNIGRQHPLDKYWLDPLIGKELAVGAYPAEITQAPVLYFTYPSQSADGEVKRVIVARVPLSRIGEILKTRARYFFEGQVRIDLADKNGTTLYSSHNRKDILKRKVHNWSAIENRIKSLAQGASFFIEEEEGKILAFVLPQPAYLDFQGQGWYLILDLPFKKALAPVASLRNQLMIVTSIFVLLACIIAFIVSRTITSPIKKLRAASEHFARGDMDHRVLIKSGDEMEDFAGSFNKMTEEIKRSRSELEAYSKSLELLVEKRTGELKEKVTDLEATRRVMLSVLEDTTEAKKRVEKVLAELKTTQAQLIESGKLAGIGQMAAGVAHEINNPLTSIMGFAQLTMSRKDIDGTLRTDLLTIEKEAKRCVIIIENLLSFAKPQAPQNIELNINSVIDATLKVVEYSVTRDQVSIVKKYDEGLPRVTGDPAQLQQVFMNIILNAAHAMPRGGVLTIETRVGSSELGVRSRKSGNSELADFVEISFTDTGIGIPDENKDKIFEPFFTTSYKSGYKGTGLGLPISHSIVQAHGGRIDVESVVGKGSTFRVVLPV